MDDDYDEFGNYIGPALEDDGDDPAALPQGLQQDPGKEDHF